VAEKLQREMQVTFATPTRSRLGDCFAQAIDVFSNPSAHVGRQLDGEENPPRFAGSGDILSANSLGFHRASCAGIADILSASSLGLDLSVERLRTGCLRSRPCAPGYYLAGSRMSVCFVALSTADLLKGRARGVTLRQSSSWSFQCELVGTPDSPNGIPFKVLSQSLGSAMRRMETLAPTFTVPPEPF